MFRIGKISTVIFLLMLPTISASPRYAVQKGGKWSPDQTISTATLAQEISGTGPHGIVVLQIGFRFLYDSGHIPGSIWAGPASSRRGLERLGRAVKKIDRNKPIVIYCGCCPWNECPNIRPAFDALARLGFRDVKVLYIPKNFDADWIKKEYPVTRGYKP